MTGVQTCALPICFPVTIGVSALFHGHCPSFGVIEKRGNELYVDFGECFGYDLCVIELNEACEAFNL